MTTEQMELASGSFEHMNPVSGVAAKIFNSRLFALNPKLRALSKSEIKERGRKLVQMIGMAVVNLERLDEMLSGLRALGMHHATCGVSEEDYETIGAAVLGRHEASPRRSFMPETQEKWWRM